MADQNTNGNREEAAVASALQELLDGLVERDEVKHAVMAVEQGGGTFRWTGAAGQARPDGQPMEAETPIWIASVTKLYIAAVIFKLQEQNRLSIDERMVAYLPGRMVDGLHRMPDGVDRTEEITLRHLLGHASGLPDYLEESPEGGRSLLDQLVEEGDRAWSMQDALQIVRESLEPHFAPQPLSASRHKIRYSDTNFQLLIEIILQVTGQTLHDVFTEMLYRPLGLERTHHAGAEPLGQVGPAATVWAGDRPLEIPLAMESFRDLDSTPDEMMRFMRALVGGEVFENPQTRELMMGGWQTFPFTLNPAPESPPWPIAYGRGMMRMTMPGLLRLLNPMPPIVGHTGISGSWLFYCPELDLVTAGTVDQMKASALPFRFLPKLMRAAQPLAG